MVANFNIPLERSAGNSENRGGVMQKFRGHCEEGKPFSAGGGGNGGTAAAAAAAGREEVAHKTMQAALTRRLNLVKMQWAEAGEEKTRDKD